LLPAYYAELLRRLDIHDVDSGAQHDRAQWPALKQRFAAVFRSRSREEWCGLLEGTDVGFAPVLSLDEVPQHPHNRSRQAFVSANGMHMPAPAPRFSRTTVGDTLGARPSGGAGA